MEEGRNGSRVMSSIGEAAVEGPSVFLDFLWRRTQAMYSEDVSKDEALECTFWMGGVWRKVEVEVLLFFEQGGVDGVPCYGEGQVHVVARGRER